MKIPTDNLFQLIKAMSASEKRYFKRHYSSNKSLTTELFDFINALDEYEEDKVKKHFRESKLSKNLKVYKVQLSDLLLKSLTSYHNKKTIRSKIRIGLEEVEILMNKQLFDTAYSRLIKIKQLCLKHEEFSYVSAILSLEVHFNFFYSADDISQKKHNLIEELERYSSVLKNIFQLKQINLSITSRHNHKLTQALTNEEIEFYKSFLKEETPKSEDPNLSFNERYFINSISAFIYNVLHKDLDKEFVYKKKNIELFEEQKHFIGNHIRLYFAAIFNNLSLSMTLGKTQELNADVDKIKELTEQHPSLERNMLFVYFLEAKNNYNKHNFKFFSPDFQETILAHIKKFKQEKDYLTVLIFIYFTLASLAKGDAKEVQFFLRRLQLLGKKLDGNYVQFFNVLDLISHYETHDILIIQNLLNAFRRKKKWVGGASPFFQEILSFFNELIKNNGPSKSDLALNIKEKALLFEDDGVRNLLKAFILDQWLDSIIEEKKYSKKYEENNFKELT